MRRLAIEHAVAFEEREPVEGCGGVQEVRPAPLAVDSTPMLRALRRSRQSRFFRKHLGRVRRWARRQPRWTSEDIQRIARLQAANHGRCCPEHRAWEHKHNRRRVEREFPDDWDSDAG